MHLGTLHDRFSRDELDVLVQRIFASDGFSFIGVPLIFVVLGVLSKWIGRRDGDTAPHRNELAVGSSVMLMTTGKIIADACAPGAKVPTLLLWAGIGVLLVYTSAAFDRHLSWVPNPTSMSNEKRWFLGIIFPNAVALCFFGGYQYFKLSFK
jgi:hypothetical protein